MKKPGPDHDITIETAATGVTVTAGDEVIADAHIVLVLKETGYKPVYYIPRDTAVMALLERSNHVTHCPYKGDATHYHVKTKNGRIEDALWSYEDPYEAVEKIRGHLAVYPAKLTIEEHQ